MPRRCRRSADVHSTTFGCSTPTRRSLDPRGPHAAGSGFFGVDQVLFASDAPFIPERGPMYIRETIRVIDDLPITTAETRAPLLGQRGTPPQAHVTGGVGRQTGVRRRTGASGKQRRHLCLGHEPVGVFGQEQPLGHQRR